MPSKEKPHKYFGTDLNDLAVYFNKNIPNLIIKCTSIILHKGIDVEGIFRINGNTKLVEKLRQSYDRHGDADLDSVDDIISIASLLKLFLRDLPSSLISDDLTQKFISIQEASSSDSKQFISNLKNLLLTLNIFNYMTLKYVIAFLGLFSSRNEKTKMSATSLSTIFGPNIFRTSPGYVGLKEQGITNYITLQFIQKYEQIFALETEPRLSDPAFSLEILEKHLNDYLKNQAFNILLPSNIDNRITDETCIIKNVDKENVYEDLIFAKHKIISETLNLVILKYVFLERDSSECSDNDSETFDEEQSDKEVKFYGNKLSNSSEHDIYDGNSLQSRISRVSDKFGSLETKLTGNVDKENQNKFIRKPASPRKLKNKSPRRSELSGQEKRSPIEITFEALLETLKQKRKEARRPDDPEMMSKNELLEEKLCVQKALLKFENIHGRPEDDEVKHVMLPLYDHYRLIKRIINNKPHLIKSSGDCANSSFVSQAPSATYSAAYSAAYSNHNRIDPLDNYESRESLEANLNKLSLSQLLAEFDKTRNDKKKLQIELHNFEEKFRLDNGRKMQKVDQLVKETEYAMYRKIKAKLKLLEILLQKSQQKT